MKVPTHLINVRQQEEGDHDVEAFIQEVEAFERAGILGGPLAAELIGAAQGAINSLAP